MKKYFLLLFLIPEMCYALLPNYCQRFQLPGWWGSGEYLLIWRKKRYYPPLVTTSPVGTDASEAGVLGFSTTTILFGDEAIRKSPVSGGRLDLGFWMLPCLGFGGGFANFGDEKIHYKIEGDADGVPIIARPFFDLDAGVQSSELISFPGPPEADREGSGRLDLKTSNKIWLGDLYVRYSMLKSCCVRLDLLGGFRYTRVDDDLDITTRSIFLGTLGPVPSGTRFEEADHFKASNDFYAGLIGFLGELRSQCWGVQVVGKVGLGNMVKKTSIWGYENVRLPGGTIIQFDEGLLARRSNSGKHSQNEFEIVPEINAQLQLRIWPNIWITAGYQYIFWPKIFLAGEQVELDIDRSNTTPYPIFPAHDKSFWAQGFTTGIYFLY